MGNPFVFLDRDGVINVDSPDYIKQPSEFDFISKSPEAVALLCRHGFEVVLITNQSMIGRKMVASEVLDAIFQKMHDGINRAGGHIKDIFYCPHTPTDQCSCRKPKPGLILDAQHKYTIDLSTSVMVGDSAKDIQAGKNAGCGRTVLVQTGNGKTARAQLSAEHISPDHVADDLYLAALWIIEQYSVP